VGVAVGLVTTTGFGVVARGREWMWVVPGHPQAQVLCWCNRHPAPPRVMLVVCWEHVGLAGARPGRGSQSTLMH